MKTKKRVAGVVSVLLIVLAIATIGPFGKLVSSEENYEGAPYEDIMNEIDESLMKTYSNNDKINSMNDNLTNYREDLDDALKDYELIMKRIENINNNIEKLEDEINKTKSDSDRLRKKRIRLQNELEGNSHEEYPVTNIRPWLFYLSLFLSINLFIWFEISSYYREKRLKYT